MKLYLSSLIFCLTCALVTAARDVPGTLHMVVAFAVLAAALILGGLVALIFYSYWQNGSEHLVEDLDFELAKTLGE